MKMRCPHCGVSGSVDDSYMGKTLSCPKCKSKFKAVPEMALEQQPQAVAVPDLADSEKHIAAQAGADHDASKEDVLADEPPKAESPEEKQKGHLRDGDIAAVAAVTVEDISSEHAFAEQDGSAEQGSAEAASTADAAGQKVKFSIVESLKEAWRQTNGVKGQIWLAIFVNGLILAGINGLITGLSLLIPEGSVNIAITVIGQIAYGIGSTILTAGLLYMGVKRLKGDVIRWQHLFSGFEVSGKVIITWLMSLILIFIGYLLLILPGIYLTVGYGLALPLVVDKRLSPWQALETSRKAIHKVWWKFFALMLVMTLITFVAAIPLGIGLIWVAPMGVVLCGVLYKTIITPQDIC